MNKDNAAQYLPLVQALADGKTIQYNESNNSNWWADIESPEFYDDVSYRIRPEPVERWIAVYKPNSVINFSIYHFDSKEDCLEMCKAHAEFEKAIKLVEEL